MSKPVVAIVGRPNVGKSTLFNRIAGRRLAIVDKVAGVTRDRLYTEAEWENRRFLLVDTGGLDFKKDFLQQEISQQAVLAVNEADVILFVVDGRAGLHPLDLDVAGILRRTGKPVILVVNKVDIYQPGLGAEFFALGFGEPVLVSAEHALNLGELLDKTVASLPAAGEEEDPGAVKVAIIGRPNVGKSSVLNAVLGEERVIVSPVPGTTRDAVDTPFQFQGENYILIDTAGIRRKARSGDALEYYSILRALRAVERSDVTLVVFDAGDFLTEQDKKVAGIPHEMGRATVLLINKWDLVENKFQTAREYEERLYTEMAFLRYAPFLFISARTGQRVGKILPEVRRVVKEYNRRVPTGRLNQVLREAVDNYHPPSRKGKQLKIYYATQVKTAPPTIHLWVNNPELVHFSYRRFLENTFRERFGFTGTPLRITFRRREAAKEDQ